MRKNTQIAGKELRNKKLVKSLDQTNWSATLKKGLMGALAVSTFLSAVPAKADWWSAGMMKEGYESGKAAVKASLNAGCEVGKSAYHMLESFNLFRTSAKRQQSFQKGVEEVWQAAGHSAIALTSSLESLGNLMGGSALLVPEVAGRSIYNYPLAATAFAATAVGLGMNPQYMKAALDSTKDLAEGMKNFDYSGYLSPVGKYMSQTADMAKENLDKMTQIVNDTVRQASTWKEEALAKAYTLGKELSAHPLSTLQEMGKSTREAATNMLNTFSQTASDTANHVTSSAASLLANASEKVHDLGDIAGSSADAGSKIAQVGARTLEITNDAAGNIITKVIRSSDPTDLGKRFVPTVQSFSGWRPPAESWWSWLTGQPKKRW